MTDKEQIEQEPCENCISRKDAIATIKNLYPDMPIMDILGARRKWQEKYSQYIKCEKEIERLPSVQPKTKWIPVSERLPEERYAVIVWCPERKSPYCAYLENGQWWIFGACFLEVTAWMPLPEPYKAESENKE